MGIVHQYKVGDTVRIWDKREADPDVLGIYIGEMIEYAGRTATITRHDSTDKRRFRLDVDGGRWQWSDEMVTPVINAQDDRPDSDFVEISMSDFEAILNG